MRIIGGNLRGFALQIVKSKNTRPLKDLVRESIFNLLLHSKKILFKLKKSRVLDLYSGTGSFGLECLSREAKNVCFVENEKEAVKVLKKNIERLKLHKNVKIIFEDALNSVENKHFYNQKFDLIFCDPPYKEKNIDQLIYLIYRKNLLEKNGIIILHRNKMNKEKFPDYFNILDERIYGISKIIFGRFLS